MTKPETTDQRKVTILLPAQVLDSALRRSGKGLTDTIREALTEYNHNRACRELLKLKGTWKPSLDFNALRDAED
ncbi:MAG: hypothetical protein SFV18_00730 [Bryobacteraceae bacterium]|nr:hypothetical protein [Bryobacteraceae bacterium]